MQQTKKQLTLSVDEIALSFSLIHQADVGKSILRSTYGDISAQSLEDKLTTASHSLLARGVAQISEQGVVSLEESVELILRPLIEFRNMIQFTINKDTGIEITNIYLGSEKTFTVMRVYMGVVYELLHSEINDIPELVNSWLDLPTDANLLDNIGKSKIFVKMSSIAQLMSGEIKNPSQMLHKAGFSDSLADALISDLKNPKKRGSVVLTDVNSQNSATKNIDEAGAGFLFFCGSGPCWIFKFEKADEQAMAQVIAGSESSVFAEISDLVNRA